MTVDQLKAAKEWAESRLRNIQPTNRNFRQRRDSYRQFVRACTDAIWALEDELAELPAPAAEVAAALPNHQPSAKTNPQ